MHFAAVKKSTKRSGFVVYSKSKESAFTAIKAIMRSFEARKGFMQISWLHIQCAAS